MNRVFVAVALSEAAREGISEGLDAAFPHGIPGRATPPANWHLTLRFIGEVSAGAQTALMVGLAKLGSLPRFRVGFGGLGAFPHPARATVLWVGMRIGVDPLADLAARAEAAAVAAGFAPERRPFSPHLTVSRSRAPLDLRDALAQAHLPCVEMPVDEVVLYRSILGGGPPKYQPLHTIPLL